MAYLREIYDLPLQDDRLRMWTELTDLHIEDAAVREKEADDDRR